MHSILLIFSIFKVNYTQLQSAKTRLTACPSNIPCKTACSRFTNNSLLSKLKLEKRISEIITSRKPYLPILLALAWGVERRVKKRSIRSSNKKKSGHWAGGGKSSSGPERNVKKSFLCD